MTENKQLLYIGNNLSKKTKYATSMDVLSSFLEKGSYQVSKASSKKNKLLRLFDMCLSVIKYRNRVDYILIDTFSTSNFYYVFLTSQLARVLKVRYIPILRGGNLPFRIDNSKRLSKMIFKNSYVNVAPSGYLKTEFEKRNYETVFIPNILDIDKYKYEERTTIQPKILWVRAFKELYNPTMAVEVLKRVKEEFSNVELCMVGPNKDNSYEKTLQLSKEYNLEKHLLCTGVLTKEDWIKKSEDYDLFINTTNFDNTPVSVMEAMALGLPVVSTNAGGMPYLIEHGKDGILVEKGAADQMAQEIIKIIDTNRQDLAQNARKKAESFGWQVVKEKWNSVLSS